MKAAKRVEKRKERKAAGDGVRKRVLDVRRRRRGLGIDPEPPLPCLKVRPWLLRTVLTPVSTSCKKPARNEYS